MSNLAVKSCKTCPFIQYELDHPATIPVCTHPSTPRSMDKAYLPKVDIIDPRCPMRGDSVTVRLDLWSLVGEVPETPESERNVHTEHCCIVHGCKYGDHDCPVQTKKQQQSSECEACSWDSEWQ
jgi:hypothetical protein